MCSSNVRALWKYVILALLTVSIVQLSACSNFDPVPLEQLDYLSRLETREREGVKVSVSVLTREEARQAFGDRLDKKRIQPVWIEIENNSERDYLLILHGVDPDYFTEQEAAAVSQTGGLRNRAAIADHFDGMGIDTFVGPGQKISGFVFSHLKQGTKQVRVRLLSERKLLDFEFFVSVPGLRADWQYSKVESLYDEDDIVDIEDPQEFRALLEGFMCCTTKKNGEGSGDPINLVVIDQGAGLKPFIGAGWDETEVLSFSSAWRTFKAFITSGRYRYSPISALYIFERPQDVSLQRARDTIHERNHLRLWRAPWRFRGAPVWMGAISRDIGVFFTPRTWNLTTHAIDSNVDEARSYLFEDLATAQSVSAFTLVDGVGIASREKPKENLLGTPWWTDGRRLVLFLSQQPVALDQVNVLDWTEALEATIQVQEGVHKPAKETTEVASD